MKFPLVILALFAAVASCFAAKTEEAAKPAEVAVTADGKSGLAEAVLVTASLFDMHGVRPVLGRDFLPEDFKAPTAAIISAGLWQTLFDARPSGVIGARIKLGDLERIIVGIMPARAAALEGRKIWLVKQK